VDHCVDSTNGIHLFGDFVRLPGVAEVSNGNAHRSRSQILYGSGAIPRAGVQNYFMAFFYEGSCRSVSEPIRAPGDENPTHATF
jgi:hypothetical protein